MPTAKRTNSGKYKVTIYDYKDSKGKVHQKTFTASTKREAERLANEYRHGISSTDMNVADAVNAYITSKEATLSPSTVKAYKANYESHFAASRFGALKITSLTNVAVQKFVSSLAADGKQPKTVRNIYGLFQASVTMFDPDLKFRITLPATKKPDLHTPTQHEVDALIMSIKDDRDLYLAVLLCAFGPMRRSEACAIKFSDIVGDSIIVRRSRVQNSDKKWVYKDIPKNYSSYRTIEYPHHVIAEIGHGSGYVIKDSTPQAITCRLTSALRSAKLPHFRLHDLRHFGTSILHSIGIPDEYVLRRGGWATDFCMKRVYRHTIDDIESSMNKKATDYFGKLFLNQTADNSDPNSDPEKERPAK